jgi:hypothetical protein
MHTFIFDTARDRDGEPIVAARLNVYEAKEGGTLIASVVSDAEGRFPLIDVASGSVVNVDCRLADGTLMFFHENLQVPTQTDD